jgi:hypothetical protein
MTAHPDPANAVPAAPAERQPPASLVDLHLVWERQLAKLASIDLATVDERTFEAVCERMEHLEGLILRTRARTFAGAMAQVRRVAASMAQSGENAREQQGLRLALAALARLRETRAEPRQL